MEFTHRVIRKLRDEVRRLELEYTGRELPKKHRRQIRGLQGIIKRLTVRFEREAARDCTLTPGDSANQLKWLAERQEERIFKALKLYGDEYGPRYHEFGVMYLNRNREVRRVPDALRYNPTNIPESIRDTIQAVIDDLRRSREAQLPGYFLFIGRPYVAGATILARFTDPQAPIVIDGFTY